MLVASLPRGPMNLNRALGWPAVMVAALLIKSAAVSHRAGRGYQQKNRGERQSEHCAPSNRID
tara:strand:+ start:296 stop:484 length:189 start_codon:yes stop_codon:yes gene_type:complete